MSIVGEMIERKDRPAYARFERIPVEDKRASLEAGHYVAKDIDYVLVTPPYSKDIFKDKASNWLTQIQRDSDGGRIPQEWVEMYKKQYDSWKNGQEMPLKGTAIRGWGVISPAQQETLIKMSILTVEDLAAINDEGVKRIGMGAVELKNKANAWLSQVNDKGPLTIKMAALETENSQLKSQVESLTEKMEKLIHAVQSQQINHLENFQQDKASESITASDIIPEVETIKRGPGRPKKVA